MKKTLIVAGILGAFAASAQAQSSVTLYGVLDAGIVYTNNQRGHSNFQQGTRTSACAAAKIWVAVCTRSSRWKAAST